MIKVRNTNLLYMAAHLDSSEQAVQALARSLYRKAAENKPSLFEAKDLLGRMLDWSLEDESLRIALFRFVDVLPSLESSAEIGRHLEEYFARVDHALGGMVFLAQALHAGTLVAPVVRRNVIKLARRFIAEESGDHLVGVLTNLRREPAAFTLDVVGEATVSDLEASAMQQRYLDLLRRLAKISEGWPWCAQIDESSNGKIPRVNLSVKLSSLCARFDPLDPNTEATVRGRLRELFRETARLGAAVTVDMEQYAFKDLTLAIFRSVLGEKEFHERPHAAIAVQAYLTDSEKDVTNLVRWARQRKRRIGVRLVKGAYWDSEIAWAQQKGWPIPVYLEKAETDASYERLSRLLLEGHDVIDAAFGSHNLRSLAHAIVAAKELGVPPNGYEIQMLYGMAEPVRQAIIQNGQRVRVYLPVGELLPGISYLIRRLMENTSNTSFLRQTYADKKDVASLIKAPSVAEKRREEIVMQKTLPSDGRGEFRNEPLVDFSRQENRERFARALEHVRAEFKKRSPRRSNGQWLESVDPANPKEVVGRVRTASIDEAEEVIDRAACFFLEWRDTPAPKRAKILFDAAGIMRERRWELAAWEVFEVGKGWREADADVTEAIDYLVYYAREMLRLAEPRETQQLPGETNIYCYEPRGVAAVIAPWNFPLAILTGMTASALVTGNCALMKPAEQSPIMAVHLLEILLEEIHDRLLARLVEAVRSLKIGPPEDPRNIIGPVIDAEAKERIAGYVSLGKKDAKCVLEMAAPKEGFFVGPVIFNDVDPLSRIAQEEIFGPVLSVIRARDFDQALEIANQSLFALTGGIFSRSPAHIEKARKEFRVGNLYINRGVTGAIVERQPFGGLKLSVIGSKARGPDYLLQLLEPRTISENTLRHGFVPPQSLKK